MALLDVIKSDYFITATVVITILAAIVNRTSWTWDNKAVAWIKKKLGK